MAIVWSISLIQFSKTTIIKGAVLKRKPLLLSQQKNWVFNAFKLIGSYFNSPLSDEKLLIKYDDKTYETQTDTSGNFIVSINGLIKNQKTIGILHKNSSLEILQNYSKVFPKNEGNITVVSDIDETIMVSYTASFFKRVFTTLFTTSKNRKVIHFTKELYHFLRNKNTRFFYVSKSESNLFSTISNFIILNKLPEGPLFLTPYLNFWQLLTTKKNAQFKYDKISFLIENNPDQSFILIGDDSQKDMEVYTLIAKKFNSNIKNIYIRQTGRKVNANQKKNWNNLQKTGIPSQYFQHDELFSLTKNTTEL